MKRTLSLLLSLIMLLSTTAGLELSAYAYTSGDYEYTVLDDGTAEITKYKGNGGNVTIPSILASYTVTSIGESAFEQSTNLSSVTIPNSVTSIGNYAFFYCPNLLNITIPNSVTSIGDSAFYYCYSLSNVIIPNSVLSIGSGAFSVCESLTSVIIPSSVTDIGDSPFQGCTNLTNINVEAKNEKFISQDGVLFNKDKTELIQYPAGNKRTEYIIPINISKLGRGAFYSCYNLIDITISNSSTRLSDYTFTYCKNLSKISIPCDETSIGDGVFYGCESLTDVIIPGGISSVGEYSFYSCTKLDSITIPYSLTRIGLYAFGNCTSLKDVYYEANISDWNCIYMGPQNSSLSDATIHCTDGVINEKVQPSTPTIPTEPTTPTQPTQPTLPTANSPIQPSVTTPTEQAPMGTKKVNGEWVAKKQKNAKIKKLTKAKKSFKATWKKVSGVTGYQIQYSTSKKFTKKTTKFVTIKKNKTTSKTVKKLKAKKKYYVRIRTYKNVKQGGKTVKVYSSWSKAKTVTTKK